ncbi:ABC transporter permease subunit [Actinomadura barringtoniae]|uniref:ABC transporter permease subunit n=1 Tax=Actinomadura barringtoniae TaxID=1427535 RepID=A0A939TB67_9ACTN|nr:ABC transporter permease subunit [Actinomadura barringtoniae]MBO2453232.1 ABC transporter permease subunit [Actinomadura barringtoniae]
MTAVTTEPVRVDGVSLPRVLRSEWIKLWTLRSTFWTLFTAIVATAGLGMLFSWGFAGHANDPKDPIPNAAIRAVTVPLQPYVIAQLAIGVLGVMIITGEYSTGMIRATLAAVPTRLPVLWAKAAVFSVVVLVLMEVMAFVAFFCGEAIISTHHIQASLSSPQALRIVLGVGLYLTVVGLLGTALGVIIRSTAGAIAALFGILLVLPLLGEVLNLTSWGKHITPYLPSNAGGDLLTNMPDPGSLSPWTGFGLFCLYTAAAMAAAAYLLHRRDA